MTHSTSTRRAPNHHGHHPGFSGFGGLIAGLTMVPGRGPMARLAADLADVSKTDHVVDVGCGPGAAAREAARRGARVTGVDPAPVMLSLARRITRKDASITWTEGAAEALPLADDSATVLWSLSTVHHWPDLEGGLSETRRVLARGGRLLAIERHTTPNATGLASHGWTDDQAKSFAERCHAEGFVNPSVDTARAGRKELLVVQATNA